MSRVDGWQPAGSMRLVMKAAQAHLRSLAGTDDPAAALSDLASATKALTKAQKSLSDDETVLGRPRGRALVWSWATCSSNAARPSSTVN